MKQRTPGFLSPAKIDQDGEIFDYIRELHEYLWRFTRAHIPQANGSLAHWLDDAVADAEVCKECSGSGKMWILDDGAHIDVLDTCPACDGTGKSPRAQAMQTALAKATQGEIE